MSGSSPLRGAPNARPSVNAKRRESVRESLNRGMRDNGYAEQRPDENLPRMSLREALESAFESARGVAMEEHSEGGG